MKTDDIVDDLVKIRGLKWSSPEDFADLKLQKHRLVIHSAKDPKVLALRVKALRSLLKKSAGRIKRRERNRVFKEGGSVAFASTALLALQDTLEGVTPKEMTLEEMKLEEVRAAVVKKWLNKAGEPVSSDGFRQHVEKKKVYKPLAEELQSLTVETLGDADPAEADPLADEEASMEAKIGTFLKGMEEKTYQQRLKEIEQDGSLEIRDQDEMSAILLQVTELARHEFLAVDQTPLSEWFANKSLKRYLGRQLERVDDGEVRLERIRLVSEEELSDPKERKALVKFIKRHEDASAVLLLCPEEAAESLNNLFRADRGLLLADAEHEPLAVTGKLGEESVGHAVIHTREHPELKKIRREYLRLQECVVAGSHDEEVRKRLQLT